MRVARCRLAFFGPDAIVVRKVTFKETCCPVRPQTVCAPGVLVLNPEEAQLSKSISEPLAVRRALNRPGRL